jgi:type IV pilus assembly protein PilO
MDPSQLKKFALLGLLLVGGLGYASFTYLYKPTAAEIAVLEAQLETLETSNRAAKILIDEGGQAEVERRLALHKEQLSLVEGLVPSSEELPDLLDAISVEAQRSGVELSLIQPTDAVAEDYYMRRTYSMGVLGTYHQIGTFLTRVASLPRIVSAVNVNVTVENAETRTGEPELEAKFAIETYVLPSNGMPADAAQVQ